MQGRIFYLAGIIYFLSSLVAAELAGKMSGICGIALLCVTAGIFLLGKNKKEFKIVLITVTVAVNAFNARYFLDFLPISDLAGQTVNLQGRVQSLGSSMHSPFCLINAKVKLGEGRTKRAKLLLYKQGDKAPELWDEVKGQVELFVPQNKNGINFEEINKAKGIFLCARKPKKGELEIVPPSGPVKWLKTCREAAKGVLDMFFDDQRAVLAGLIFGEKTELTEELKTSFRRAGTYHVLVVSGLHMSIISQIIFLLLIKLKFGEKSAAALAAACCFVFAFIVGFTPSVVRSLIMLSIYFLGRALGREPDSLNSLGFSVIALLVINPYSVWDLGLQLSFLSSWGIIVLAPRFGGLFSVKNKLVCAAKDALCVSLAATIATTPLVAMRFLQVPIIGPVANVFLAPLVPVIFALALVCGLLKPLFLNTIIYKVLITILSLVVTLIISVVRIFSEFSPVSVQNLPGMEFLGILLFAVITVLLLTMPKSCFKKKEKHAE